MLGINLIFYRLFPNTSGFKHFTKMQFHDLPGFFAASHAWIGL